MIDLDALRDRLRAAFAAFPQLSVDDGELEHSDTGDRHRAIVVETSARQQGHVCRMTIAVFDDAVHFFAHVHGVSRDLTTRGAQHFRKAHVDPDEVFALVHSCWVGGDPS